MSACKRRTPVTCDCGDVLIHQTNRGKHESSSAFGQFIHDQGEAAKRGKTDKSWAQLFWMDVDGAIFKRETKVLRIIEHKTPDGYLSDGQRAVLPLLALALRGLAAVRLIHRQSGVFVVRSNPPHEVITVRRVRAGKRFAYTDSVEMTGRQRDEFLQGKASSFDSAVADAYDVFADDPEFET